MQLADNYMPFKWISVKQRDARRASAPRQPAPSMNKPARWFDSDVGYSFRTSPVAMRGRRGRLRLRLLRGVRATGSRRTTRSTSRRWNWATRACRRPGCRAARAKYLLGTDDQGRDILSALMYGARISLVVGLASVLLSMLIGVSAGPAGRLSRRLDRRLPHAPVRRDAVVPGHPGGAADRRRRPRAVPQRARRRGLRRADPRDLADRLGAVRAHGARLDAGRAQQGIRAGGARHRRVAAAHHAPPRAAQRAGPGAGAGHHPGGHGHHHRGHAVLPGRGRAADLALAGHADPRRQRLPVLRRVVDHRVPRR